MRTIFAAGTTAALVLLATGAPVLAQDETMNITGRVYFDHNGNDVYDAGDGVREWSPGIRVTDQKDGRTFTAPVGAGGRYAVYNLARSTYLVENLDLVNYTSAKTSFTASDTVTDGDFPLVGHLVKGLSFVDTNGDGTRQADEKPATGEIKVTGRAKDGSAVDQAATPGADGSYAIDLPLGEFTLKAPHAGAGLALAKPRAATDIDWATGVRTISVASTGKTEQVDLRYFAAKANVTVKGALSPAKDTYLVGEQITAKVKLLNSGDVPVAPQLGLGLWDAKVVRHSDNLVAEVATQFALRNRVLPGETAEVELTFATNNTSFTLFKLSAFGSFGGLADVDESDNFLQFPVKVVEKSAETTAPATSTTAAAAPATTTTTQAVAKAGNKTGLASTGASPLGFLALGTLLLAAGTGAFFMARRRRS